MAVSANEVCCLLFIILIIIPFFFGFLWAEMISDGTGINPIGEEEGDDSFVTMAMYQSYDT